MVRRPCLSPKDLGRRDGVLSISSTQRSYYHKSITTHAFVSRTTSVGSSLSPDFIPGSMQAKSFTLAFRANRSDKRTVEKRASWVRFRKSQKNIRGRIAYSKRWMRLVEASSVITNNLKGHSKPSPTSVRPSRQHDATTFTSGYSHVPFSPP
jgi:hypothetical protein